MYSNKAINAIIVQRLNLENEVISRSSRAIAGDFVQLIDKSSSLEKLSHAAKISGARAAFNTNVQGFLTTDVSGTLFELDDHVALLAEAQSAHKMCIELYTRRSKLMQAVYGGKNG